jgi:hypothetical protein
MCYKKIERRILIMTINYDDWYSNLNGIDRINLIKLFENDIDNNVCHINMSIQQIIFLVKCGKVLDVQSFDGKKLKSYFSSLNNKNEYFLAERNWETNETKSCELLEIPMLGRQIIDIPKTLKSRRWQKFTAEETTNPSRMWRTTCTSVYNP